MGLRHSPKAISEDPKNSLYFMPWAQIETDKSGPQTIPTMDTSAQLKNIL